MRKGRMSFSGVLGVVLSIVIAATIFLVVAALLVLMLPVWFYLFRVKISFDTWKMDFFVEYIGDWVYTLRVGFLRFECCKRSSDFWK